MVYCGEVFSRRWNRKPSTRKYGQGKIISKLSTFLLSLHYRSVILAICSKNDLKDIQHMFAEHSGMILRDIHIALFAVNWQPKAENLKQQ